MRFFRFDRPGITGLMPSLRRDLREWRLKRRGFKKNALVSGQFRYGAPSEDRDTARPSPSRRFVNSVAGRVEMVKAWRVEGAVVE
jgi:hypothetical protein